ncbi:glycoside hydrolase family 43 protein [Alteromonas oceanisediminis]|uniref:glycoside hydrolase family 43 protein n=1 Tax=Alteromonas oceanisediminis TaxID=2836180 RepID=UPI0036F4012F
MTIKTTNEAEASNHELSDAEKTVEEDLKRASSLKQKDLALVDHIYTADPSAHVFEGKIYIYPSHDIETDKPINDNGDHFAMEDYHVLSYDDATGKTVDHGVALHIDDVEWASKQMWAPDAAHKDGMYYLYFPARDESGVFRIGVATSTSPSGPFSAQKNFMKGTFSIDPAVFEDEDQNYYLYFGGIWGGQLQNWHNGAFQEQDAYPQDGEPAIPPKVAKLNANMLEIDEPAKDILLLDEDGTPIKVDDFEKRYFEGPWIHKFKGKYYFSYSTGNTHKIVYATGDSPYGPFTYKGVILNPVLGWTNHHSIVEYQGKWYLFYHDSSLSGGQTHLRCVKMTELTHLEDGTIQTIDAYE